MLVSLTLPDHFDSRNLASQALRIALSAHIRPVEVVPDTAPSAKRTPKPLAHRLASSRRFRPPVLCPPNASRSHPMDEQFSRRSGSQRTTAGSRTV